MRRRLFNLFVLVLALALAASACGDDSDSQTSDPEPEPEQTEDPDPEEPEEPEEPEDGGDGDEAETDQPDGTDDPELTASDRGITEDTITLGLAIPDVSMFSNQGDIAARFEAVAAHVNANGGIIGRQIEFERREWDLLDTAGFEAACVSLTQDVEVFAVITRTPANFGAMTCLTELSDHITINALDLDGGELARSSGRLFSTLPDQFTGLLEGLPALVDELADAKVALSVSSEPGGEDRMDAVESALTDLGIEVVEKTIATVGYADDQTAAVAEQILHAERWATAGATHVIGIGNAAIGSTVGLIDSGHNDDIVLITPNIGIRTLTALGADLAQLQMLGVAPPTAADVAEAGEYGSTECIDIVVAATGDEIILRPDEEELNAVPTSLAACAVLDFLSAVLEAIGPNPTSEELVALTTGGFDFAQTGAPSGSTSATKAYTSDLPGQIYDWDGTEFIPRG